MGTEKGEKEQQNAEKSKKDIEKKKKARISKEIKRLNSLFERLSENTKKAVDPLINNAAFMTITLEDLQNTINAEGAVAEYKNGENQFGTKKSPEIDIYNVMIKNHAAIIKQLTELLPVGMPQKPKEPDAFEKLLGRGQREKGK